MSLTALPHDYSTVEELRIPPHSIQAEQSLLGGVMLDNRTFDLISDLVSKHDFYRRDHRIIFAALNDLSAAQSPLDVVTLTEHLEREGKLQEAGGFPYLGTIAKDTPSAANVKAYAKIVRERSMLRRLISVGSEIADLAFNPEGREVAELMGEAERRVHECTSLKAQGEGGPQLIRSVLGSVIEDIETAYQRGGEITGLPMGFPDLDRMTNGLQPGSLNILAARPSMGKTALAMNVAEHVAVELGKPVLVFSLEMPNEQIAGRMVAGQARLSFARQRLGKLADDEWPRLTNAVAALNKAPIYVDDTPALSPLELRSRARRTVREHGPFALAIVDYLQLMHVPEVRVDNRNAAVSEITRSLKSLAKELNAPVLALSQLNRQVELRKNRRPQLSDLRDSGAIEQDADLIVFIYRDEVYDERSPDTGKAEIIIGKQRNGPVGMRKLAFFKKEIRFASIGTDKPDARPQPKLVRAGGTERFEY